MPVILHGGPLGSGLAQGAAQAPTWAGLQLEQMRQQRQKELADLAIQEAQDAKRADAAGAQAYADLGQLQQSVTQPQQLPAGQQGPPAAPPVDPTDAFGRGLAQVVARAQQNGANAQTLSALIQDGAVLERRFASQQDVASMTAAWTEKAGYDPIAASALEQVQPYLAIEGVDAMQLAQMYEQAYGSMLQQEVRTQRNNLKFQSLQERLNVMIDPKGPFGTFALEQPESFEGMIREISKEMAEIGGIMPTATMRVMQEQQAAMGGYGQGGPQQGPPLDGGGDIVAQLKAAAQSGNREAYNAIVQKHGLDPQAAAQMALGAEDGAAPKTKPSGFTMRPAPPKVEEFEPDDPTISNQTVEDWPEPGMTTRLSRSKNGNWRAFIIVDGETERVPMAPATMGREALEEARVHAERMKLQAEKSEREEAERAASEEEARKRREDRRRMRRVR